MNLLSSVGAQSNSTGGPHIYCGSCVNLTMQSGAVTEPSASMGARQREARAGAGVARASQGSMLRSSKMWGTSATDGAPGGWREWGGRGVRLRWPVVRFAARWPPGVAG